MTYLSWEIYIKMVNTLSNKIDNKSQSIREYRIYIYTKFLNHQSLYWGIKEQE